MKRGKRTSAFTDKNALLWIPTGSRADWPWKNEFCVGLTSSVTVIRVIVYLQTSQWAEEWWLWTLRTLHSPRWTPPRPTTPSPWWPSPELWSSHPPDQQNCSVISLLRHERIIMVFRIALYWSLVVKIKREKGWIYVRLGIKMSLYKTGLNSLQWTVTFKDWYWQQQGSLVNYLLAYIVLCRSWFIPQTRHGDWGPGTSSKLPIQHI